MFANMTPFVFSNDMYWSSAKWGQMKYKYDWQFEFVLYNTITWASVNNGANPLRKIGQ